MMSAEVETGAGSRSWDTQTSSETDHVGRGDRVRWSDARLPVAILGFVLLLGAGGLYVLDSTARDDLRARTALRTEAGANFIGAQTSDVIEREQTLAEQYLSGRRVSEADFIRASKALALDAALLLDSEGMLLHVLPADPSIRGDDMTDYPHLGAAVRTRRPAVSPVVRSAALGVPVVGFAVPFSTAAGIRVFSGGLNVQASALGDYMRTAVPLPGAEPFLIDGNGLVLASNGGPASLGVPFVDVRPTLARALDRGEFSADLAGQPHTVSAFPVPGTTWTLLAATPESVAYDPAPPRGLMVAAWLLLLLIAAAAASTATSARSQRRQWMTANARFRSTFDNPLVGMLLAASDGVLIATNERFSQMVDRRSSELVGTMLLALIHPDDRELSQGKAEVLLTGKTSGARFDARFVCPDGTVIHAALTATLIRDTSGRPDYFTIQVVDVTRQRAAEEARATNLTELELRTGELEVANAELALAHSRASDLASMISHDLRQPLFAITGFSELLVDEWDELSETERVEFVGRIRAAGQTADNMLKESLTETALQGGAVVPVPARLPVAAAAQEVVNQLPRDQHTIIVSGPADLVAYVTPGHFVQVLTNLLTNAVKYGAPPVKVDCAPGDGHRVVVRVTDHGPGVPDAFVPHMFDRFTRADSARTGQQRGTGLGLHIVRRLLEVNDATIDYQPPSSEGDGGFVVTLPAANDPAAGRTDRHDALAQLP